MIIEQIGYGASFQEAYEKAKELLAAPDEAELHHEIIQEAKRKLFGLKTEPAKVKVWYEIPDPKPERPAKKEAPKPERQERPAKKEQPKKEAAPKKEQPVKKEEAPKKEAAPKKEQPKKEAAPKKEQPVKKEEPKKDQPKKEAALKKEQPKKEAKKEAPEAPKAAPAPAEPVVMTELPTDENDVAVKFLRMVTKGLGVENCEISLAKAEGTNEYVYTLSCGDEDGALIGRRGETLDAIQYLLRLTENKGVDDDKHRKLTVNVGNYREKRHASLKTLAEKNARKVLKYGRNVALEPMSAYERRIIHTAIQGIEGVTSHSVGSDSNRKVIISLEEGVTPTNPSTRGSYDRDRGGRGGRRDDRRGGGRGGRREPYKPSVTREPRKDNAGSLYGRIDLPKNDEE